MSKLCKFFLSVVFLSVIVFGTLNTPAMGFDGAPRPGCLPGDNGPCPPQHK